MKKDADRYARQQLINNFFTKHGLGDKLRHEYDRIMDNLSLPGHLKEFYKKSKHSKEKSVESDEVLFTLKTNFSEDQVCIFPSFYKFLIHLYRQKADFSIVLRTFGTDMPMVVNELN